MNGRILIVVGGALVVGVAIALAVMTRTPSAPAPAPPHFDAASAIARAVDALVAADAASDAAAIAARVERRQIIAGLVESGSGAEAWDAQGTALLDSLAHRGVEMTGAACFVAGCGATFTFPSEAEYRRRIAELESSDAYRAWTGGKRLTDPEVGADGRVTIAVALYRPD